jgi:hypothetical protein
MEKKKPYTQLTIYLPHKEKQRLFDLADKTGFTRQDFLKASLVSGAVIIDALDKKELQEMGFGKAMLSKGQKIAAALMAVGTSSILNQFVEDVGRSLDLGRGLEQFSEWETL